MREARARRDALRTRLQSRRVQSIQADDRAGLMGERPDGHSSDQEEDAGLYALGCLRGVELDAFETHLAACTVCQAIVVADLRTLRALGAAQSPPSLPPGFRERLLQRGREELTEIGAALRSQPVSSPGPSHGWLWLVGLASALMVCLAASVGVVYFVSNQIVASAALGGSVASGTALIELRRSGRVVLVLHNLPAPPEQYVYQAWLANASGQAVPTGTATSGSGSIEFYPSGVGQQVLITLEPTPGSSAPTSKPILSGVIPPSANVTLSNETSMVCPSPLRVRHLFRSDSFP